MQHTILIIEPHKLLAYGLQLALRRGFPDSSVQLCVCLLYTSYRDLKTSMSTKMLGETLEQHCALEFEQRLRAFFPRAYFEKDNDVVGGTKGDFIFRDYAEDGTTEYISIMFEMKNEADTTATKHRNEDFLKKLDEDRRKKGCEYAILVSLLEADSELYNGGIVDLSLIHI